jgi:hypothetical protein
MRKRLNLSCFSGLKNDIVTIGDGIRPNAIINQEKYDELNAKLNIAQVKGFAIHPSLREYYCNILNAV